MARTPRERTGMVLCPRDPAGRLLPIDALQRFASKCEFDPVTGCVIWRGGTTQGRGNTATYGSFWYEGRRWFAHRWAGVHIHGLLVNDLEVTLQLLNMREFAEWLRTNGDPAHARFADEIIDAQDALAVAGYQGPSLGENVDGLDNENRENEKQALALDDMRKVLVETGALASDDRTTPLPDLLRALLS